MSGPSALEILAAELRDFRRDVREQFADARHHQDGEFKKVNDRLDVTNGRVGKLELAKARWDGLRAGFRWVPALVLSVASGAVVAVLSRLIG